MKTNALIISMLFIVAMSLMACSGTPKVDFAKATNLGVDVQGEGYAWGENAKEKATAYAKNEAIALGVARGIEFTYLKIDSYVMFKTNATQYFNSEVTGSEQLEDGGIKVTVSAKRDRATIQKMRYMVAVNFQIACKGKTFRQRVEHCNSLIFERTLIEYAKHNFDTVPEKMMGNFTFFAIERKDNGHKMTVDISAFVGTGAGKMSKKEKAMVLMNAWRVTCAKSQIKPSCDLFKRAMTAFPNPEYAEEYALFEASQNRIPNAIKGIKWAIKINQFEARYLKILYQLYKKTGNETKMAAVEAKLVELEAWEDDPGADITSNVKYRTKIKWVEGNSESKEGQILFRDADLDEDE